jgi:hypothetical protein
MFDFGTDTNLANTLFIGVPPAPTDGQGAYPLMPTLTNVNPRVRRSPGSTLSIRSEGGSVSRRRAVYGDMYADGLATQYASSTAHLDNRDKKKTEKQPSRSYRARSVSLHAQQAQQAQSASAVRDSYLQTKLAAQNAEKAGNAGKEKAGKGEKDKAAKDKGKDKAGERSKQENGFLSVHGLLSSQSVQSVQSVHSAQSGNTMQSLHSALGPPVTKPLGTSAPPSSYVAPNLASHPQRPAPPVRSASTTDVPTKAGLAPASAATIAAAAAAAPSASACKPESDRTPALPSLAEIASLKSLLPHSQLRAGVVTPTGSDDEWEGEKPSRSYAAYVRKPASVCAPIHRAPVAKPSSRPASVHPVTRRRATSNVDYRPPPAPAPAPVALPLPHQLSAIPQPRDRGLARYAFSDVGGLSRPPSVVRFDFGREARYVPTLSYAGTGGPPTPSAGSAPVAAGPQKPEACPSFLGSLLGLRRRSSSTKEDLKPMTAPKPPPKPQQAQAQASPVQPRTTSQFKRGDLASLEAGILPFAFAGVPPPAQAAPPLPPKTAGRAMSIRNLKAALGDLNLPGGQRQRGARNVADDDDDSGANTPTALHGAMPYSDSIIPEGPEDILAPDITCVESEPAYRIADIAVFRSGSASHSRAWTRPRRSRARTAHHLWALSRCHLASAPRASAATRRRTAKACS